MKKLVAEQVPQPDLTETPRAHSFQMYSCGNPECGLHLVSLDAEGKAICHTLIGRKALGDVAEIVDAMIIGDLP
jgi:hypothetical protein